MKLLLTETERKSLSGSKIKLSQILDYAPDELEILLNTSFDRAREVHALAEFQTVRSVGIRFAEDLVFMGYYSLSELAGEDGAKLTDEYEQKKGYWTDPCVEDQFRLVVHVAKTKDMTKNWWDFTAERKKFRLENGYPKSRPRSAWHAATEYQRNDD